MAHAPSPGSESTTSGEPPSPRVRTEAERESWRQGFAMGLKAGTTRVLQSPTLEQMATDLMLSKLALDTLAAVAHEREKRILWLEGVIRYLDETAEVSALPTAVPEVQQP
jgi:hypothetical protein